MNEKQGRKCENCQRFEPIQNAARVTLPGYGSGLEGMALRSTSSIPALNQAVPTDASSSPLGPWSEDVDSWENALTNSELSGSSSKEEPEEYPPPQPRFWIPPEIPEHW
jgi:hypothetical protein